MWSMRIAASLVLLFLTVEPVSAASVTPSSRVTNAITVRAKPDSSTPAIGKLKRGEKAEYVAEVPNWYQIRFGGRIAYVHKAWSRYIDGEETVPLAAESGQLQVHFIDVGQGDSTMILCPNGKTILIDAGSSAHGSPEDIRGYILELLDRRERRIDVLIVTHPDIDHYNLLPEVLDGVTVGRLFRTGDDDAYNQNFRDWLKSFTSPKKVLYEDDYDKQDHPNSNIDCGTAEVYILAAGIPTSRRAQNFVKNSLSAVVMVRYGDFRILLTGDGTFDTEDKILERYPHDWLKSNVLKIGHHGSRVTSTGKIWADTVKPEVAIASAPNNSIHGHPTGEVVKRLEDFTKNTEAHPMSYSTGTKPYHWTQEPDYEEAIYSTATNGNVVVTSDGHSYKLHLAPYE
jgi:competence protein ComEC